MLVVRVDKAVKQGDLQNKLKGWNHPKGQSLEYDRSRKALNLSVVFFRRRLLGLLTLCRISNTDKNGCTKMPLGTVRVG